MVVQNLQLNPIQKCWPWNLLQKKIRSNCLAPSFVQTPMVEDAEKTISKEVLDKFEKMMPLGFGEPEDVAISNINSGHQIIIRVSK